MSGLFPEREVLSGPLSQETRFRLFVSGELRADVLDKIMRILALQKEFLLEDDNAAIMTAPDPVGEGGKHTPSPWRADGCEIIGDSRVVATVHWCSGMEIEDQANIRLIAAAPIMLAACEFALIIAKEYDETGFAGTIVLKQKLIAAIAKAKGQTS